MGLVMKLAQFAFVWISLESSGYSDECFCASRNTECLTSALDVANRNEQDDSKSLLRIVAPLMIGEVLDLSPTRLRELLKWRRTELPAFLKGALPR
jgi:hypothetical protein